ncbi:two-component system LytT family sensor kinase [Kribbella steppae]|uniref:Two-component system LytT family sensor kinase n=1 Tax=Kribbella steppae TaxID=2512223 RepID=A0A4R2GUD6_9ACTN|nr:histidine kinase [Kribbella steppae]TCO13906.1 two-component system LytT family sensor kinase [Kribbella steppae]
MFARRRKHFGTLADKATYATLHTASLATPHLREGLTPAAAGKASRHLRDLLGTAAIAICDSSGVLAWDGVGGPYESNHRGDAKALAAPTLRTGRTAVLGAHDVACGDPQCPIRTAVVAPIVTEERVVAVLLAYSIKSSAALVRATEEVARWVSGQVELAELNRERTRAMEAELRALRAQISPHFIYNALAAIASFVRTDPERARELLLEFADFSRYALRRGGEFTTLADELRNVERYLVLEQARFGDRLKVSLLIAPEVLPVVIPFLVVQPLVENAVRHGLEGTTGVGRITIRARDRINEAEISVEDDGAGSDPEVIRAALSGESGSDSVGLGNVDARLRQVYGDAYGLVVETAVDAGTKVTFRVPKYSSGVHAVSR